MTILQKRNLTSFFHKGNVQKWPLEKVKFSGLLSPVRIAYYIILALSRQKQNDFAKQKYCRKIKAFLIISRKVQKVGKNKKSTIARELDTSCISII